MSRYNMAQSPMSQVAAADQFKNHHLQKDLEELENTFFFKNMSKPQITSGIAVDLNRRTLGPQPGKIQQKQYNQKHGNTIQEDEQSDGECSQSNGQGEAGRKYKEYSRSFIKRGPQQPEVKKVEQDDDPEFEEFDELFISE